MLKRILLVSTSAHDMNGHPTGLWLEELAAPYNLFKKLSSMLILCRYRAVECRLIEFLFRTGYLVNLSMSLLYCKIRSQSQMFIFRIMMRFYLVVGHGAIVDFPGNPYVANLIVNMYNNNRIVAAVCHGVSSLVGVKNKDGSFLVRVSI